MVQGVVRKGRVKTPLSWQLLYDFESGGCGVFGRGEKALIRGLEAGEHTRHVEVLPHNPRKLNLTTAVTGADGEDTEDIRRYCCSRELAGEDEVRVTGLEHSLEFWFHHEAVYVMERPLVLVHPLIASVYAFCASRSCRLEHARRRQN